MTPEGRDAIIERYTKTDKAILELNVILVYKKVVQGLIYSPPDCEKYLALDADAQDFERLLMVKPLLTVRDLSVELTDDTEKELLRNYEFNISQGIVQRVSRFFDSLALMEAPPARDAGDLVSTRNASGLSTGVSPDSARGGVMGFGRKRNVCNQEKSAHTVVWEKDEDMAALKVQVADLQALALVDPARKAAEEAKDADMATLKALVAEMQAFVAPSAASRPIPCPR